MASVYRSSFTKKGPNGERVKKRARTWTIEYLDAHGVRRKVSSKTRDKRAAELLAADLERQAALGRVGALDPFAEGKQTRLEEHLQAYEGHLRGQDASEHHRRQALSRLRAAFTSAGASYPPDVTPSGVTRFLAELRKKGRSARTRNSYLASLRAFFNWCVRTKRLGDNPTESLSLAREANDRRRERRALTGEEVARLILAARERRVQERLDQKVRKATPDQLAEARREGEQRALAYRILFETGLRVGELRQLAWADLRLGEEGGGGSLRVRASVSKSRKECWLPLRPSLAGDLRAWREENPTAKSTDPVLRLASRPVAALRKDLARAGIAYQDDQGRYADLHALRHSLATHLARSCVAPRVSQSVLRHSSLDLTMQTYTDAGLIDQARALEHLPDLPSAVGDAA